MQVIPEGLVVPSAVPAVLVNPPEPPAESVPPAVKLELTTRGEWTLAGIALAFTAMSVMIVSMAYTGFRHRDGTYIMHPIASLAPVAWLCLAACLYYWAAFLFTNEYYILVPRDRSIIFHRRAFGRVSSSVAATQDDCYAIAVGGYKRSHEQGDIWEYNVFLIKSDGGAIILSDPKHHSAGFVELREKGMRLAALLGCAFVDGPEKSAIEHSVRPDGRIDILVVPGN